MAQDIIMLVGSVVFFVLFAFLIFIFVAAVLSIFRKERFKEFKPFISILIPCYNEEKNIGKCLDNIFKLNYPKQKVEIIVVDDGSTDNTADILKEYKKKYSNISVIMGEHNGKSESLNLGVKHAKHDLIISLDADTFVHPDSIKKLVRPFYDKNVGATNGSCIPHNSNSLVGIFQNVEYHYNNLIRKSFSTLFRNGIWFFGAFACYRKSVLKKIGYFKKDTMTEDMDIALEIYSAGYRIVNVHDALGYTIVPHTFSLLYKQRMRWWAGVLQALSKNRVLFTKKSNPSILFLFINQYWWSAYALISFPIIMYQVYYWLPATGIETAAYLFRWFTLIGPFYVIYKIPVWGISLYNIFGVSSGIISVFLITWAIYLFKDRLNLKNILAIFLYFPYTIVLNGIIVASLIKLVFMKKSYFIA